MHRISRLLIVIVITAVCAAFITPGLTAFAQTSADLSGIKTYLLEKVETLHASAAALRDASKTYFDLASEAKSDYAALWQSNAAQVTDALKTAKDAWITASPLYEQVEGIVAGVPSLSEFDVILDAGSSAADDPASAVPFDLTLPDGRVLEKPGNLFGLLESTLWGTRKEFVGLESADLNANGKAEFGEVLPEANMLLGSAEAMLKYTTDLQTAANDWQPTLADAFTALVVMTPTMSEYFESWKLSRFVAGESSEQAEFAVISRLADIQDILSGLQVVYEGVSPAVAPVDAARDTQIKRGLEDLRAYVSDLYTQEKDGKRFSAEEADLLGSEAQQQAEAIAGQVAQVAAQLNITLPE